MRNSARDSWRRKCSSRWRARRKSSRTLSGWKRRNGVSSSTSGSFQSKGSGGVAYEPQRGAPTQREGKARGIGPPYPDPLGEIVDAKKTESETDQRRQRMGEHTSGSLAPGPRIQEPGKRLRH